MNLGRSGVKSLSSLQVGKDTGYSCSGVSEQITQTGKDVSQSAASFGLSCCYDSQNSQLWLMRCGKLQRFSYLFINSNWSYVWVPQVVSQQQIKHKRSVLRWTSTARWILKKQTTGDMSSAICSIKQIFSTKQELKCPIQLRYWSKCLVLNAPIHC